MDKYEPKTPAQILQAALNREKEARNFYADQAIHCHVDFIKELFERLETEEAKHMHLIQDMLSKLERD